MQSNVFCNGIHGFHKSLIASYTTINLAEVWASVRMIAKTHTQCFGSLNCSSRVVNLYACSWKRLLASLGVESVYAYMHCIMCIHAGWGGEGYCGNSTSWRATGSAYDSIYAICMHCNVKSNSCIIISGHICQIFMWKRYCRSRRSLKCSVAINRCINANMQQQKDMKIQIISLTYQHAAAQLD